VPFEIFFDHISFSVQCSVISLKWQW